MKVINFLIFYIQFHLFSLYKKIFGKKSKKYMLIFMGRFPENFKHGIKPVLDYDNEFRFTFGPGSLVVVFHSKKSLKELNVLFTRVYSEYVDIYFLFNISKTDYAKHCIDIVNNHLFYPSKSELTIDEKLDKVHLFIDTVIRMRDRIKQDILNNLEASIEDAVIVEDENEASFGDISEDSINKVIDKITEFGLDSLTEEEQQVYNKIFKK